MSIARASVIWLVGVALGAAFLWLALRAVDVQAALGIALQADILYTLGIVVCALAFVGAKALRWGSLLRHLQPTPAGRLLAPVLAGIAVNYAIPHSGELVRAWLVARRERLNHAAILASIAVERLFDFCSILLLGLLALLAGRAVLDTLGPALWVLLAFILVILVTVLPFAIFPRRALGVARTLLMPLPVGARELAFRNLEQGRVGLESLQRGSTLVKVLGHSIIQWVLMAACAWFSLRAVGVDPNPIQAVATVLLLVAGSTLPTAPGHVGTTQVAFLLAAEPFGIEREEAIAASIVYNVFLPVPLIALGAGVLLRTAGRRGLLEKQDFR